MNRCVRLVVVMSGRVAKVIADDHPEVQLVELGRFSIEELRRLLDQQGYDSVTIPEDVRETLRLPVLARLYLQLSEDLSWKPTREYELYERMWRRISKVGLGALRPNAASLLGALACSVLDSDVYPWPQARLRELGIDDETQLHLERAGWLTSGADAVRVAHDRLLAWAVAQGLFERRQDNRTDAAELGRLLLETQRPGKKRGGRALGYVAMDVLWLFCDSPYANEVPDLIQALEGWTFEGLYRDLLPTLGSRVIEPLIERMKRRDASHGLPTPLYIGDALISIGRVEPDCVRSHAAEMVRNESGDLQEVGMRVLAHLPSRSQLDRLWDLHCQNETMRHQKCTNADRRAESLFRRGVSIAALRTCIEDDLSWLAERQEVALVQGKHLIWRFSFPGWITQGQKRSGRM